MSDNREFFRDTVERILDDTVTSGIIEAAEDRQPPQALIAALRDNGILSMLAPEAQGGIDATLAEAVTIVRAAGAAAAPGPLLETLLGQSLMGRAKMMADGAPVSLVLLPKGMARDGIATLFDVPWSEAVESILIAVPEGSRTRLICTARTDWLVEPGRDAAGEPRDILRAIAPNSAEPVDLDIGFDDVLRQAALLRAGQMLGAMEWVFRRSVEYAMERQQFGREIGKFQAVQQMLAILADHVLAATVIVEAAADSSSFVLAAAARSRLADATDAAIAISHQVHGAIGFSREYALNQRTRRLMAWRDDYGSIAFWRRTLGERFAGCQRDAVWPAMVHSAR